MALNWTDQQHRDDESRRRFLKEITALTGWAVVTGATAFQGPTAAIAGDKSNSNKGFGGLKGRILLDGDVPERKEVDLSTAALNAEDLKWFRSLGPILNEDWVVDPKTKAVRWVYVWLIPEDKQGTLTPHESLTVLGDDEKIIPIDQEPTGYVPHAVAIREEQGILMRNQGPVAHVFNMQGFSNPSKNIAMPPGSEIPVKGLMAERAAIKISCPPHPWERMTLRVFDHPYFAVTNAEGEFEFKMVPTGPCRLIVWHETLGFHGGRAGRFGSEVNVEGAAITDLGTIKIKTQTA
ncbi:twin-arginine translocation signal domain-containing protein [Blastopirellula marina]|uniref:Rhamnogalacturonan lyase domain-containing protein n=1 Tax=Blastopirellula marina TaxID=124 RepID=A0A2S8G258_9BACT|nr:twin-arginine translocation signal domain-containing protein [Blastopirellula marina]PQO38527.1 hypothetical protein C5Y98_10775 [Blastopirellula marina]PTL45184.1 hypothetical protein C5Y97_10785 [Blastopirellula marina]